MGAHNKVTAKKVVTADGTF